MSKTTTLDSALVARLTRRSTKELRAMYTSRTGKSAESGTRDWLLRELGTPGTAPARTPEAAPAKPAKDAKPTKVAREPKQPRGRDTRLPAVGETITRTYKGVEHKVVVTDDGFRHEGAEYSSLTALALAITGYPAISGPAFFFGRVPAAKAGAR